MAGKLTSQNYFKSLSILHLSLVAGVTMFGIITCFLNIGVAPMADPGLSEVFKYLAPALALMGIVLSHLIFKKQLEQIPYDAGLNTKMTRYRSLLILKYALLEGPALFSIIVVFLTGNLFFLVYAGILVIIMLYFRPTRAAAIRDLKMDQREAAVIEDPEGVLDIS